MIRIFLVLTSAVTFVVGGWRPPAEVNIRGIVTDITGAPLPGATVIAFPLDAGPARETVADSHGAFEFADVPPGTYRVDAELTAFKVGRRSNVLVERGTTRQIAFTLAVEAICECIIGWAGPGPDPQAGLRAREGIVMDGEGRRLAHAVLEVQGPEGREVAYADRDGRFRVRLSATREWPLRVRDSGFGAITAQVSASSSDPIVVTLKRSTVKPPDTELMARGCRCPRDLFTHKLP